MASRNKRRKGLRKAVLTAVALYGGATAAACCRPLVCDPPPPPNLAPTPTMTPMIFDPPPPPATPEPTRTATAGPDETITPMICDPAPPPATVTRPTPMLCDPAPMPPIGPEPQATATVVARRFRVRSLRVAADPSLQGAAVRGVILGTQGQPLSGLAVVIESTGFRLGAVSGPDGAFYLPLPAAGNYRLRIEGDLSGEVPIALELHEMASTEWVEATPQAALSLPLAEIRRVDITRLGGATFRADTPWPGARFQWSVTGGALAGEGEAVEWRPEGPGRYLLQVVADWGRLGLAVDARVLVVGADGRVEVA